MMIESPKFQGLSMSKVNAQPKLGVLFLDLELFAGSLSSISASLAPSYRTNLFFAPLARLNILGPLFSHPSLDPFQH
jgi:hypothetical protein